MSNLKLRSKILQAGRKLTKGNIDDIKYLLKEDIGEGPLEEVASGTDLLQLLEKRSIFSINDFSGLVDILEGIDRKDIINFLLDKKETKVVPKPADIKERLDQRKTEQPINQDILDYIANLLAGDWKRNARFLQLEEHNIEIIENDCRKTYERSIRTLHEWMRSSNEPVSWIALKEKSLFKLPRHDIIRQVEAKYPQLLPPVPSQPAASSTIQNGVTDQNNHTEEESDEEEEDTISSSQTSCQDTLDEKSNIDTLESPVDYAIAKTDIDKVFGDKMENMAI